MTPQPLAEPTSGTVTAPLAASIEALIKSLNDATFQQPAVPAEAQPELRKRGWFECVSCSNWYPDDWHYREECCLGCGDPCDGTWEGSAPVGWWTDPAVVAAHRGETE